MLIIDRLMSMTLTYGKRSSSIDSGLVASVATSTFDEREKCVIIWDLCDRGILTEALIRARVWIQLIFMVMRSGHKDLKSKVRDIRKPQQGTNNRDYQQSTDHPRVPTNPTTVSLADKPKFALQCLHRKLRLSVARNSKRQPQQRKRGRFGLFLAVQMRSFPGLELFFKAKD